VHFTAFCLGGPFFSGHGVCVIRLSDDLI